MQRELHNTWHETQISLSSTACNWNMFSYDEYLKKHEKNELSSFALWYLYRDYFCNIKFTSSRNK